MDVTTGRNGRTRRLPASFGGTFADTEAGSVDYAVAGAAMRQALQRAREQNIKPRQRRVLDAVLELTASRSKLADATYVARIAELAGLDETDDAKRHTKRALRQLADLGIIQYHPGDHYVWTVVALPGAELAPLL